MGKLALFVLVALVAVYFSEAVGQPPVRINPYVLKYLQGYYKKHKTLPPALKRWAYQQLQKRQAQTAPLPAPVQTAPVAPAPAVYVPPPLPAAPVAPKQAAPVAPVQAPATPVGQPQGKAGYGHPPVYQPPTYHAPSYHRPSYHNPCHGRVHAGFCHGKYAGHYSMAGTSSCYIQCDQWGRAYGKPCAPGTYWRYGGPEPAYYNHCA